MGEATLEVIRTKEKQRKSRVEQNKTYLLTLWGYWKGENRQLETILDSKTLLAGSTSTSKKEKAWRKKWSKWTKQEKKENKEEQWKRRERTKRGHDKKRETTVRVSSSSQFRPDIISPHPISVFCFSIHIYINVPSCLTWSILCRPQNHFPVSYVVSWHFLYIW